MRYLSLHLPYLATDRIRRRITAGMPPEAGRPQAAAVALLVTAAKVKSAFRLVALDAQAQALGLRPMLALADARAMHPGLGVHDDDPEADRRTRDAIVDWCRGFTPLAAPDGADGIILDVSGAAHLFGGETGLMEQIAARLARQGFAAQAAIADTPAAAWALARYGGPLRQLAADLAEADLAKRLRPLPLAALRLESDLVAALAHAGLRRIGDLLLRPRAPIAARFGRTIHHRLDLLLGRARDPISPVFEAPPFLAERRFPEGLARHEDIERTVAALAHDLCGLLARHGEGARRLDLALYRVDGIVKHIAVGTSRPLRDPTALARLFRERIAAAGEDGLETGYGFDVIRLAAVSAERLDASQPGWADAETGTEDLADLIDRLGARFGLDRLTRPGLGDSHQPEGAADALPARASPPAAAAWAGAVQDSAQDGAQDPVQHLPERPIRLFERPEPIDTIAAVPDGPPLRFRWRRVMHQVAAIEGPERIGPDWWKPQSHETSAATRDYFRAEDTQGRRFWLYREGLYRESVEPRWFLHGLFA